MDIRFDNITRNARGWAEYFERSQQDDGVEKDRISKAFGLIKDDAYGIIKENLLAAIERSSLSDDNEFSREELKQPLLQAFLSDQMLRCTDDGTVYLDADTIAGSRQDLEDGINAAREVLKSFNKSDKKMSPAQKSAYWRYIVFPSYSGQGLEGLDLGADKEDVEESEDLWTRTIGLRFSFWEGIAPYWYFLEHGNISFGSGWGYPYPRNQATNFVFKTEMTLNRMMQMSLQEVDALEENLVNDVMEDFVGDPENYEPYDILKEFYSDSRKYYIYITPTKKLGVALAATYRRMSRR